MINSNYATEKAVDIMRRAYLLYLAGLLVAMFSLLAGPSVSQAAYGDYISTISTGGLNQPAKVAVNSVNGDVYVTDAGNKAVKRYGYDGSYDSSFSLAISGTPVGIATNGTNIFVGDDTNNCVWIYDMNGGLADLYGTGTSHKLGGASGTALKMPNTVAISPGGHIFVVDGDSDKVYIYNANGSANTSFGVSNSAVSSGTTINLYYPTGLAMANSTGTTTKTQYFYLGDQGNNRVQKISYAYNATTKAITTAPTHVQTIGTGGPLDAFGKFLRVSDVAWDSVYSRLVVVDSLQMVAQLFDAAGATMSQAFNYSGGVQGYLNVPTGAAIGSGKCYVASNQGNSLVLFNAATGTAPAPITVDPAVDITPSTTPVTVNYTVTDPDSATVTVSFYYEKVGTSTREPISLNIPVTLVGGTYSGSFSWDWAAAPGPVVGSYKVVAVALDDTSNVVEQYSAGSLLVVTPYDGCANYTNAHYALYGAASIDYDGDTMTNCEEVNGTYNTAYGNAPTNMALVDSDSDGLDDGIECGLMNLDTNTTLPMVGAFTIITNPTNADTDGGGVSDAVEFAKATSPIASADDITSSVDMIGLRYLDDGGNNQSFINIANVSNNYMVFDMNIFDVNGVYLDSANAINLAPNASVVLRPSDYVNASSYPEGNLEIRQTNGYLVGGLNLTSAVTDGYSVAMPHTTLKNLTVTHWVYFQPSSYNNDVVLHNPSTTVTANVDIDFYKHDGTYIKTVNLSIPPHASILKHPTDFGVNSYVVGNSEIFCREGSVAGYSSKYSGSFGYAENLPSMYLGTRLDLPHWVKYAPLNYSTFISIKNPTPQPQTLTMRHYAMTGAARPDIVEVIPAHGAINKQPQDWGIDSYITGTMTWDVTSGVGVAGYAAKQSTNYGYSDLSNATPEVAGAKLYVPKYWYEPDDTRALYMAIRDAETSGTASVNFSFYDESGLLRKTTSNYTANANGEINTNSKANAYGLNTSATGLMALSVVDGDVLGYLARELNTFANKGFSDPLQAKITDVTAPDDITDLVGSLPGAGQAKLDFTEPGDDGSTGKAYRYVIRSSSSNITEANWQYATEVGFAPKPVGAGNPATVTITGLAPGTYYFAVKACDDPIDAYENPNWTALSNVVSVVVP